MFSIHNAYTARKQYTKVSEELEPHTVYLEEYTGWATPTKASPRFSCEDSGILQQRDRSRSQFKSGNTVGVGSERPPWTFDLTAYNYLQCVSATANRLEKTHQLQYSICVHDIRP